MSKIEELIEKLCPNGVKFEKIENLTNFEQPTKYIVKSTKYNEEYAIPVLTAGQSFILGYTNEQNGIYNASKEKPVIIFDDFTGAFKWVDFPFKVKSSAIKIITAKNNKTTIRYLYHMMGFLKFCSNEHKRLWISAYSQFKVAVPPLEVQCEIVHILDDFTLLSAELSAELKARQKQYEYYMDKIFNNATQTKMVKLSDVLVSLKTGLNPRKFFQLNTPDANGYYVTVRELGDRNVRYWESKDRINQIGLSRINERSNLEINDVLFSGTGTIGRVSIIEEKPEDWNVKEGVYILKPKIDLINPVFLMYLMKSNYMRNIYSNYIVGSPVSSVPMKDLKNVEFDLPSIEEQEKIVRILDRFDQLCTDISEGLPAEIEARQKQYEYYRDKLLTFKELKVNE
mgnify:FL=1